jgi:hypothetical protein
VFALQGSRHIGHHGIHVAVSQGAGFILQNQAHSETLASRFHALAGVTVEQHQIAQRSARRRLDAGRNRRPRHRIGDDEREIPADGRILRQWAGLGQRARKQGPQVEFEGDDIGVQVQCLQQARMQLSDPAQPGPGTEHIRGATGMAEAALRWSIFQNRAG